jgi:hypothetical protein
MCYEQKTLRQGIEARNRAASASDPADAIPAEGAITGALSRAFALFENYPQLKANENISRLMEELSTTENKIAFGAPCPHMSALQHRRRSLAVCPGRLDAEDRRVVERTARAIQAEQPVRARYSLAGGIRPFDTRGRLDRDQFPTTDEHLFLRTDAFPHRLDVPDIRID